LILGAPRHLNQLLRPQLRYFNKFLVLRRSENIFARKVDHGSSNVTGLLFSKETSALGDEKVGKTERFSRECPC